MCCRSLSKLYMGAGRLAFGAFCKDPFLRLLRARSGSTSGMYLHDFILF